MNRSCLLAGVIICMALLASIDGSDLERRLLTLTNQARSSARFCGGTRYPAARALVWNSALGRASSAYARAMANTNRFRHDPNMGGVCKAEGENIGNGYQTPEAAVDAWIRSPSHCANLMNGQYDRFGGGRVGTYWVQKFGRGCR